MEIIDKNDPAMEAMRVRIKEVRKLLGESKLTFAEKMGVKQNTWSNIETGVNPFSERYVHLVCFTHKINEKWLLSGEGEMFEKDPVEEALKNVNITTEMILSSSSVPSELRELIKSFTELTPKNQRLTLDYLNTVLTAQRNASENK